MNSVNNCALLFIVACSLCWGATNPDIAIDGQLAGDQAIVVGETGTLTASLLFPSGVTNPGGSYTWTISNGATAIFNESVTEMYSERNASNTSTVTVLGRADADVTVSVKWEGPPGWGMREKSIGVSVVEFTSRTYFTAVGNTDNTRSNVGYGEYVTFECRRAAHIIASKFEPRELAWNRLYAKARALPGDTSVSAILTNGRIAKKMMRIIPPTPITYTVHSGGTVTFPSGGVRSEQPNIPDVWAQLDVLFEPTTVSFTNLETFEEGGAAALPVTYDGIFAEAAAAQGIAALSHLPPGAVPKDILDDNLMSDQDMVGFTLGANLSRPSYSPSSCTYFIPIRINIIGGSDQGVLVSTVIQRHSVAANGACTVTKQAASRTVQR